MAQWAAERCTMLGGFFGGHGTDVATSDMPKMHDLLQG